jgi:uncharacterized membrane protein
MNETMPATGAAQPRDSTVTMAHVVYALHTASVLICATSIVTIAGAFVFGIPSIVAVILNYATRSNARDTWIESHYRWQIRTFWFALMWSLIAMLLFITLIGIPLAWLLAIFTGLWVIYRIIRGWIALANREPVAPAMVRA